MFCKIFSKSSGGRPASVLNVNNDGSDPKLRRVIYLGMSHDEYVKRFHGTFMDKIRREEKRRKIIYHPHATLEDILASKSTKNFDGKRQKNNK